MKPEAILRAAEYGPFRTIISARLNSQSIDGTRFTISPAELKEGIEVFTEGGQFRRTCRLLVLNVDRGRALAVCKDMAGSRVCAIPIADLRDSQEFHKTVLENLIAAVRASAGSLFGNENFIGHA